MTSEFADLEEAAIEWDENGLPFSTRFNDHYYSRNDGRAETRHVFIEGNGLPKRWSGRERFVIGELGFGTGLNFLETWRVWREHRAAGQTLLFQSVEAFPMSRDEAQEALSRWPDLSDLTKILLDNWDQDQGPVFLDRQTVLQRHIGLACDRAVAFQEADAWFLDGFAPDRNPDMWSKDLMITIWDRTVVGGTLASYTAAGWVRRNLQEAGFIVEKRPGFGPKRDMIAGVKS
ncbi:MAG: tRNA (5-methylaminomethyl-2-thiouridine)(34)-methyltransferase MnmD [Rhizobiaceae bacterium]